MNGWRVGAGWAAMAVLVLVVMACGDAVAPHVPPTNLFLPAGTAVTPDGDPIFRSEGGLSEVRSARAGARPTGVGSLTNWGVRTIDLGELIWRLSRDGIPSIDAPRFVAVAAAGSLYTDNALVMWVSINGDVRAYPLQILHWHEIVNDVVGGVPVAVTYCPVCNAALVFERRVGDQVFEFGTSGFLRDNDLVMYDRTTESLWQQIGGAAIVGAMVGARLPRVRASVVPWSAFRDRFPDAIVLSQETGFGFPYARPADPELSS